MVQTRQGTVLNRKSPHRTRARPSRSPERLYVHTFVDAHTPPSPPVSEFPDLLIGGVVALLAVFFIANVLSEYQTPAPTPVVDSLFKIPARIDWVLSLVNRVLGS